MNKTKLAFVASFHVLDGYYFKISVHSKIEKLIFKTSATCFETSNQWAFQQKIYLMSPAAPPLDQRWRS